MSDDDDGFFQNVKRCPDSMIIGTEDHQPEEKKGTLGKPAHPTIVWTI